MPLVADNLPVEGEVLCEGCGYRLHNLPDGALCPECGKPAAESTSASPRKLPHWERPPSGPERGSTLSRSLPARWLRTSADVLLSPSRFFSTLLTRGDPRGSIGYARLTWIVCSAILGFAGVLHLDWILTSIGARGVDALLILAGPILPSAIYLLFEGLTKLVAWLTKLEGAYWGYRLPTPAVLRALHYLSAQMLPIALAGLATVGGFRLAWKLKWADASLTSSTYLYTLSAVVVLGSLYVFWQYTRAMRKIMWANV
jgi:hypothetical protein